MKQRELRISPAAQDDLARAVRLIRHEGGNIRADKFLARIEVFVRRLAEFAEIGSKHDHYTKDLRIVGIPGLRKISLVFHLTDATVTVLRIGYLGQNVVPTFPHLDVETRLTSQQDVNDVHFSARCAPVHTAPNLTPDAVALAWPCATKSS